MPKLLDIYRYQNVTDYHAMVRYAPHIYIKATDGAGRAVVHADGQVAGTRRGGGRVGLYHYAQATPGPRRQADVLAAEVKRLNVTGLPPALDAEESGTTTAAFCQTFLRRLRNAHGFKQVTLYASASVLGAIKPDRWRIPGLVVWVAAYGINDGVRHPDAVTRYYRGKVHIHQYTSRGQVPGISGAVDVNEVLDTSFLRRP